jgi:hypothetical protein
MRSVRETVLDRALLFGAAILVLLGTLLTGYVSDVIGRGSNGLLVTIETVFVFGAALSYCRTSWPKWYTRSGDRTLILGTYSILLAVHGVLAGLVFRRLRFEWGMWVWMGISLGEIACVVVILELVVRHAKSRAP